MAKGRMLLGSIAQCAELADLSSDTHRMLHAWILPHLDRDGLISADPRVIKATTCPMLDHVTRQDCAIAMVDLIECNLAVAYVDDKSQRVLMYQNFGRHQHHTYKKEGESKFTSPANSWRKTFKCRLAPDWLRQLAGLGPNQAGSNETKDSAGQVPESAGATPGDDQDNSGLMERNGVQRNGRECAREGSEGKISPEGERVLIELRKHSVLESIATAEMAEQGIANMTMAGGQVSDAIQAVQDVAKQAGTARAANQPWSDVAIRDTFARYTGWSPRAPGARRRSVPPPQRGDTEDRKQKAHESWEKSADHQALCKKAEEAGF